MCPTPRSPPTISQGQRAISLALTGGLVLLWLSLLAVSVSVTGRLRRQSVANAFLARHDSLTGMPNRAHFSERACPGDRLGRRRPPDRSRPDRPGPVQGGQRHARPRRRRPAPDGARPAAEPAHPRRRHPRPARRRRVRGRAVRAQRRPRRGRPAVQLRAAVSEPAQINGVPLAVEASAGFALAPDRRRRHRHPAAAGRGRDVRRQARPHRDRALPPEQDQYDSATLTLVAELARAHRPTTSWCCTTSRRAPGRRPGGRGRGPGALAAPDPGTALPRRVPPAAEQTELIEDLTTGCSAGPPPCSRSTPPAGLAVAVNVSARSLARADFAADLLDILAETRPTPG